jgi:hypothetical protein
VSPERRARSSPALVVAAAVAVGSGALIAPSGTAARPDAALAPAQAVTLTVFRTFDKPTRQFRLRFSGMVAGSAAGEDVTVMQQRCGYSFSTAVAGAQTLQGGFWEADPPDNSVIALSATFRARWRDAQSDPVTIRPAIPVFLVPIGKGRLTFRTTLGGASQDMRGRLVVLERLRAGRWTVVRRQRLTVDRVLFSGYVTTFRVPTRWTVRARVPATSAAPCFKANTSDRVRSG